MKTSMADKDAKAPREEHRLQRASNGQLYRVIRQTGGDPCGAADRFTSTGAGSTVMIPVDEEGEPVAVDEWEDPASVESRISYLRENFECVGFLARRGREARAYPGAQLDDLREHLISLHGDLEVLDRMRRDGELDRLDAEIVGRLASLERDDGLEDGELRRGRRSLPERHEDLLRRIGELAPVMERWGIPVPDVAFAGTKGTKGTKAGPETRP